MSDNYDRIARFYEVDMARNMPFDDVGFYLGVCRRRAGAALELGCGSGRILLPLLAQGVAATGIDASEGMLRELRQRAQGRSLTAAVCRMDLRSLAFRRGFEVVLLPYSLVTYLTGDDDLARAFAGVRDVLLPGGLLVIDAFIPRPVTPHADFRLDYRRPFGEHVLARWKRIAPQGPRINRIERRYQVLGPDDRVLDQVEVAENIRPFDPEQLRTLVAAHGFAVDEAWWDYTRREPEAGAQFFTVVARAV
jgi:SAM-dependent methyltransferase